MALGEDFTFNKHLDSARFKQAPDTFQFLDIWRMVRKSQPVAQVKSYIIIVG